MPDTSTPDTRADPARPAQSPHGGGIGFAVFLVLAGLALLAERLGWLSDGFDWLFPIVLIAWGVSELYQRILVR